MSFQISSAAICYLRLCLLCVCTVCYSFLKRLAKHATELKSLPWPEIGCNITSVIIASHVVTLKTYLIKHYGCEEFKKDFVLYKINSVFFFNFSLILSESKKYS